MSFILKSEDEYEDLLGLWSDLESGLAMLLSQPVQGAGVSRHALSNTTAGCKT